MIDYCQQSAQYGFPIAQNNMGNFYKLGIGTASELTFSYASDQRYKATEALIKTFRRSMKNARKIAAEQGHQIKADNESLAVENEDLVSLLRRYRYN